MCRNSCVQYRKNIYAYVGSNPLSYIDPLGLAASTPDYSYNGFGQRVAKTGSAGATIYYVYDERGRVLGDYDEKGAPMQETVYLGELPVAVIAPAAESNASDVYYVYADHLRTPRVITRASDNKMVWRWDQADPFGLHQPDENPGGLGVFTYNLRFPGQVFDRETNNHYNYFRDYDPQAGRYIQSDPIGLAGGINTYAYAEGNPISYIDPLGLFNPAKGVSAIGNSVIAGASAASGGIKIAIAAGLAPAAATGAGALPPTALGAWGAWNLKSAQAAWKRVQQQWTEAQCEKWDDWRWKNLWGMAPGGTSYDDPNEPKGPWDYIKSKGWWEFISEAGYF